MEKRIIHAKTSVDVNLDKAVSDKLAGLDTTKLLTFINDIGVPAMGRAGTFNDWWKSKIEKQMLKRQAIFVFTNVNPKQTDKIADLLLVKQDIEAYTEAILVEIQKYDAMPILSAKRAIAVIDGELARINQESQRAPYQTVRADIVKHIDVSLGQTTRDSAAEAISALIETLSDVRAFQIEKYKELYTLIYNTTETTNTAILHSTDGRTWDEDLVACDKILMVLIDGSGKLAAANFYAETQKSVVLQEFNDVIGIVKDAGILSMGPAGKVGLATMTAKATFIELEKKKMNAPVNVVALFPGEDANGEAKNDTVKIKIKEKVNLSFRVGVSSALIDRKMFKIDNKQLVIELDSADKEEWKQHLILTFNLNPWYRTGDYSPEMFKYDKENSFLRRLSVFVGMNLSLAPLDNIYLGAAYDLSKNFTINGGATWNNTIQSGKIDIGEITSVKDALKLSNKKYGDAKWFFALTFRPAVISDLLGLKKDSDED
ncbi:hypothetical protein [Dawidia soli]|nr:hypothetical protein [Dawidia soli]